MKINKKNSINNKLLFSQQRITKAKSKIKLIIWQMKIKKFPQNRNLRNLGGKKPLAIVLLFLKGPST